jgi:type II secretory pathway component GspD/PulD (secretin)/tetratricopeptide (TPR) repeat protein
MSQAKDQIQAGDFAAARTSLDQIRLLRPDAPELAALESELRKKEATESEPVEMVQANQNESNASEENDERAEKRAKMQKQVEGHLDRAEDLINRGRYEDAMAELEKVRELQPQNQIAQQLERRARLAQEEEKNQAVAEARAREMEQKNRQVEELIEKARRALRKDDYEEAMALVTQATTILPNNEEAKQVGREAAAMKAKADREAEIERLREEIDRRLVEANTYLSRKQYDRAIEITKQVLLIDENNPEALRIREKAEEGRLELAQEANLQEARAHFERAEVFYDQKEWDAAEEELRKALELYPNHSESRRLMDRIADAREREARQLAEQQERQEEIEQETRAEAAQEAFERGLVLYEEGDIIGAWEAWEQAVQIDPEFQEPLIYMDRTEADYQKALAIVEEEERLLAEDAKWEAKLDQVIGSFEIPEPTEIETVLTNILGVLSGFNFIVQEGVQGKVEVRISDKTLREILDLLLIPNGFAWTREDDTIIVSTKFQSRVFPLTPEEFKRVQQILEDPESLQDPELDLRRIIYGDRDPEEIPGRELRLNYKTHTLIVRDSAQNIAKVESWLQQLEDVILARQPLIYRSWALDCEIAADVHDLVKRFLIEERSGDEVTFREEGKRIIFDETNCVLVIRDTPENIEHVEEIILREDILQGFKEGILQARLFRITDDTGTDPESVFRRLEVIRGVVEILSAMLYEGTGETEEEANARGRRIFYPETREEELRDPRFIGTITVVDTEENLRKVQDFLGSAGGAGSRSFYVVRVLHRDIADLKYQLDRAIGRVRDTQTGTTTTGYDLERELQLRALIVEDPETYSLIIRSEDPAVMDDIRTVVELLDQPVQQVEIETRLIQVALQEIRSIGLDWSLSQIGEDSINWSDNLNSLNMITSNVQSFNFNYQTLGPTQLSFVLNLISTLDSAEILSAPKITTVSSPEDPAEISVVTQEPYVTSIDIDTQGDDDPRNDLYIPNFDTQDVGITLEVLPTVLGDGYVIMDINPVISTVAGRIPVVSDAGGDSQIGGLNLTGLGQLIIDESSADTRMRVKDGDTVVIGGLIKDEITTSVNSVPILGNIPLLGYLFRDYGHQITKETLLMFVTVHVVAEE